MSRIVLPKPLVPRVWVSLALLLVGCVVGCSLNPQPLPPGGGGDPTGSSVPGGGSDFGGAEAGATLGAGDAGEAGEAAPDGGSVDGAIPDAGASDDGRVLEAAAEGGDGG